MARRSSRMEHARSNRIPVWFGATLTEVAAGGGGSTLLTVLNAAALALRPFTIIRSRLVIHVESDQIIASELVHGVYARIVIEEEAADAGIGSIPTPISEPDAGYFVYEPFFDSFLLLDSTGVQDPSGVTWTVDSKAMRKVGLSQDVVSVVEIAAAPGAVISVEGRTLVKLH